MSPDLNFARNQNNAQKTVRQWRSTGLASFVYFASLALLLPSLSHAQATGKLNDTGITLCGTDTRNDVTCTYADDAPTGYPRQDGGVGRSAKENALALTITGSDSNSKGYNFTKLRYDTGAPLASTTALATSTTTTNWGCTKDNVTGLIWLVKTPSENNFRLRTNTYRWYSADSKRNGNDPGNNTTDTTSCYGSNCDTNALIVYTNALNICGEGTKHDWRLPTRIELLTIVDLSKQGTGTPTVDTYYFPNMVSGNYWTRDSNPGNPQQARTVNFGSGGDSFDSKSSKNYVILVRPATP